MGILGIIASIASIILGIATIVNLVMSWRSRKKQDSLDAKIKANQIQLQELEIKEAKKEEVLDNKLDDKFKVQLDNFKSEQKTLMDVMNSQGEDIKDIREKQELLHNELISHKNESIPFSAFMQIFNYSKRIGCDGWVPKEDYEEKYKLILENWFDKIKDLVYQYYDNKVRPGISLIQYDVESDMLSKIESFYSLSESIVDDIVAKESFRGFIESKKNLHSSSQVLGITLKKNGLPYNDLNQKIGTYLIEFSSTYQKIVGEWLKLQKKYHAAIIK